MPDKLPLDPISELQTAQAHAAAYEAKRRKEDGSVGDAVEDLLDIASEGDLLDMALDGLSAAASGIADLAAGTVEMAGTAIGGTAEVAGQVLLGAAKVVGAVIEGLAD